MKIAVEKYLFCSPPDFPLCVCEKYAKYVHHIYANTISPTNIHPQMIGWLLFTNEKKNIKCDRLASVDELRGRQPIQKQSTKMIIIFE